MPQSYLEENRRYAFSAIGTRKPEEKDARSVTCFLEEDEISPRGVATFNEYVVYWFVRNGSTVSAIVQVVDTKGGVITSRSVHSFSGLFAFFSALNGLQHLATRICSHSRNAITRTLRGILHGVRKYLDLPRPRGTVLFCFSFIANDFGCGKQRKCKAILLSAIGEKTYRVLEDLCTPQKPSHKSLEEITQLLLEHFKPT